jgi:predicted nucleotidyltransferase
VHIYIYIYIFTEKGRKRIKYNKKMKKEWGIRKKSNDGRM